MRAGDVSLGGVRLFADEPPAVGDQLELELYLPDQSELTCRVEVVWTEALPEGSPARFDVGVKFVDIDPNARSRLAAVLKVD
jgi:hypothetical protein